MWAQLSLDHRVLAPRVSPRLAGHKPAPNHVLGLPGRCPHVPVCHCCFQLALAAPQPRDSIVHVREVWGMPSGWQGHHVDVPWQPAFPPVCRFTAFSRFLWQDVELFCTAHSSISYFWSSFWQNLFYFFFFNLLFFSPECFDQSSLYFCGHSLV